MKTKLLIVVSVMVLVGCSWAADDEGMPLSVYQKLKSHFDALYGPQSAMLPGPKRKREDIEKDLKADAAANKDVLLKALASKSVIHRELAVRSLEYCGDKKAAVEALCRTVNDDADENVRRASAAVLARLPDAVAVESLCKALADSADPVRTNSVIALGNIKDPRATPALLKTLSDDAKPMVRMQAAVALSKIEDKESLEPLKKALENEQDERAKIAIAGAIRKLMGKDDAQTEEMPTAEGVSAELTGLSKDMKDMEDKLRGDRHDTAVQSQGGDIDKRLQQLIQKVEKASQQQSSSQQKQQKKGNQQQQQQQQGSGGNKNSGSPMNDSKLGGAAPPGALNPATVDGRMDAWAKLPAALRDEIMQFKRDGVPVRWQNRVHAYIWSINAEEAKKMDK